MAALSTIAIIAGLAISATAAGVATDQSLQSAKAGRVAEREGVKAQNRLQAEAQAEREKVQGQQAATAARTRQRLLAAQQPGGRSDVLTGGMGDVGQANTTAGGKQALGL